MKHPTKLVRDMIGKNEYSEKNTTPYVKKTFDAHNCKKCGKRFAHADRGTESAPWLCRDCN